MSVNVVLMDKDFCGRHGRESYLNNIQKTPFFQEQKNLIFDTKTKAQGAIALSFCSYLHDSHRGSRSRAKAIVGLLNPIIMVAKATRRSNFF